MKEKSPRKRPKPVEKPPEISEKVAALDGWLALLREQVQRFPELKEMTLAEVAVKWGPSLPADEFIVSVTWWQSGVEEDYTAVYPKIDWEDGLAGLIEDAVTRAIRRWKRIKQRGLA